MNKAIVWIVAIVIVLAGGYLLLKKPAKAPTVNEIATTTQEANPNTSTESGKGKTYTVTYTDAGYSPGELTIAKGDTVIFENKSSGEMWTASGPHPAHTLYSGTDARQHCPDTSGTAFDQCGTGDTYSFTFDKAGTWPYHNHVESSDFGKIIVR